MYIVEEGGEGREQTDCGWAKGPSVFLGGIGIVEQENRYVVQSNLLSLYCYCMHIPPPL